MPLGAVIQALELLDAATVTGSRFFDPAEWDRVQALYGPMTHLQGPGRGRG